MRSGIIALIVVGVLLVAAISFYLNYLRVKRLKEYVAANGWTYLHRVDQYVDRWNGNPFDDGDHRRTDNGLTGTYRGVTFVAFEYMYDTHSTDSKGNRTTTTHHYSVIALELGIGCPDVSVTPEGVFSPLAGRVLGSDIELESEDFNRTFTVLCKDRKFASDVLHPRTMQALLPYTDVGVGIRGGDALAVKPGKLVPDAITRRLDALLVILEGVPEFVWKDLGGKPVGLVHAS